MNSTNNKNHTQVYKPKNPPTLTEWYFLIAYLYRFHKLSLEERVLALTTVSAALADTFINMTMKIELNGNRQYTFAEVQQ